MSHHAMTASASSRGTNQQVGAHRSPNGSTTCYDRNSAAAGPSRANSPCKEIVTIRHLEESAASQLGDDLQAWAMRPGSGARGGIGTDDAQAIVRVGEAPHAGAGVSGHHADPMQQARLSARLEPSRKRDREGKVLHCARDQPSPRRRRWIWPPASKSHRSGPTGRGPRRNAGTCRAAPRRFGWTAV